MRPLAIAAIGGAVGAIALVVLFPRLDPLAMHPMALARADAIRRAGEWSATAGVPTPGWSGVATVVEDEKANRYRRELAADPASRLLTPVAWGVLLTSPDGAARVRVKLAADGRLVEWQSSSPGSASPSDLFSAIAGGAASVFAADTGAADPAWDRPATPQWPAGLRIESSRRDGRLVSMALKVRYEKSFDTTSAYDLMVFVYGVAVVAGFLAAIVTFVLAWRRGAFTWRLPAAMALVCLAWTALIWAGGAARQDFLYARGERALAETKANSAQPLFRLIGAGAAPLLLLLFAGAGYGLARNRYRGKWSSIELAARGQWARRQVCRPLAAGLLAGVAVAAIPYAVAKLTGARMTIAAAGALGAPMPDTALLSVPAIAAALGFLGFALPLALRFRHAWLRFGAAAIVVGAFAVYGGHRFESVGAVLAQGAAAAGIGLWLFAEFDVLAVAAAFGASRAVVLSAMLLAQPAAADRDAGLRALLLIGTAVAAAAYFAICGRDAVEEAPLYAFGDEGRTQSSRERLEAEFAVARKAQQDALPAIPPPAAGFTFDAVCEPALQVGGDLYDFFPLPDGRLGAAVADVSGKGVPAALYMMVTKGLIGAAAQDSGDLRHILQSLNLHLHRACKRKVFVTMAAVALDPESRRVQYGRAGHNPIVWRRARRGETVLVKPGGVGLGMCGAEPFARSLRLEEFELEPGDALVLYSDGVTEAVNPSMDQYGEERLMRAVEAADGSPATEIRASILRDLAAFASGAPARDDVTVVAIRAPG